MTTFLTDELPLHPTAELASDSLTADLSLAPDAQDLLFVQARTANTFTGEAVSDGQLRAVYDLVKWAPTAMNSQPLRIVMVRSSEARERLVAQMSEGNRDKTRRAPLVAVLAADLDFHDELHRTAPHAEGARERFAGDEDGRRQTALTNATLQAGYFLLGVRAAGLAAGPMGGFDAAGVARELFPDGRHQVLLVVNIGHPGEGAFRPRQLRLAYDEVVATV